MAIGRIGKPSPWLFTVVALFAFGLCAWLYLRLDDPWVLVFGLLFGVTTFARPLLARMPIYRALITYLIATLGYLIIGILDFFWGANRIIAAVMIAVGLLALFQSRAILKRIENQDSDRS